MAFDEAQALAMISDYGRAINDATPELLLRWFDPRVEFNSVILDAEGRLLHGHEEVRAYVHELHAAFEEIQVVPGEFVELATDVVLMYGKLVIRGRTSGARVDTPLWITWEASTLDGHTTVVWLHAFTSEEPALAAAEARARDHNQAAQQSRLPD